MPFWNFKRSADDKSVELRIAGDIVDDEDAWLYEWLGMPAASPNAFRDELANYRGQDISVWVNSNGGSVFAATGIYNALQEHKKTGAKVTTIADGKVMSAAMTPFMAGDDRKVSPCALLMVHNPLTQAYGYASDLRKAAEVLDVVKECIINAYQIGTGLSRNKISNMMDGETYMSAQEAIKDKFATEMLYTGDQKDESKNTVMNFCFNRLDIQNAAGNSMRRFAEVVKQQKQIDNTHEQEDDNVEIKTVDDLQKNCPELVNQIANKAAQDAVNQERSRITALDALDDPKNEALHEIVNDAKEKGKTAEEIQSIVDIVKKHAPEPAPETPLQNTAQHPFMNVIVDNKKSGADNVKATGQGMGSDQQDEAAAVNFMAAVINKKNGVKK